MTPLEEKANRLQAKLKARTHRDGTPRRNHEQSVAMLRAELEIIDGRIKYAAEQGNTTDAE